MEAWSHSCPLSSPLCSSPAPPASVPEPTLLPGAAGWPPLPPVGPGSLLRLEVGTELEGGWGHLSLLCFPLTFPHVLPTKLTGSILSRLPSSLPTLRIWVSFLELSLNPPCCSFLLSLSLTLSVLKKGLGGKKDKVPHPPQCSPLLGAVSSLGTSMWAGAGMGTGRERRGSLRPLLPLQREIFS